MQHINPPPSILQGNLCILGGVYDLEEGKRAGQVSAPLIVRML
jgi:hypothetical protein